MAGILIWFFLLNTGFWRAEMGNRLTKIYTRTGDDGSTGLSGGERIPKDHPRIEAIGAIDELNSAIGVVITHALPADVGSMLTAIQHTLFDLGGELSMPETVCIHGDQTTRLEQWLDTLNAELPPLREFILPGGTPAAATCHLARAICRRAERRLHTLSQQEPVNPAAVGYLNRLSDLLFVIARELNRVAGKPDVFWRHERK
jgi:cob(I)alamin adenosyltransferase